MKLLKNLMEVGRTIGYYDAQAMNSRHDDPHARAIDMINQAVEDNENSFELIGDVDSLVEYLAGKHHDWNSQLEQLVRDIIAEETGTGSEEEEEYKWGDLTKTYNKHNREYKKTLGRAKSSGKQIKKIWRGRKGSEEQEEESVADRLQRMRDENEKILDDSRKRRMARKYAVHGPSRRSGGVRRRDLGRPRGTLGFEQEEKYEGGQSPYHLGSKRTNPKLSPQQRGQAAADMGMMGASADHNEETGEYNPYPIGSQEYEEYEKEYLATSDALTKQYPHI